jgi:asparagine synthase (glutamine-hydrolysing)
MFRYLGFAWNAHDPAQSQTSAILIERWRHHSSRWREVANSAGLRVFCAGIESGIHEAHTFDDGEGVVLGSLFERNSNTEDPGTPGKARLGPRESGRIIASRGRYLVESCWGCYVALFRDPASGRKWIVKDPTGGLPCFLTTHRGVTLAFSSLSDCQHLSLPRFTINWGYVSSRVARGPRQSESTAFNEVSEICGGQCVELAGDMQARHDYWNPVVVAATDPIDDTQFAVRALRSTAKACADAWASCHDSIVHKLSGGLDSSIVLGCLAVAPTRPRITCLTHFVPGGNSNERPWARLAAARAGCEHIEAPASIEVDFSDVLRVAPSVNPVSDLAFLQRDSEMHIARTMQASAISNGDGGDGLFGAHSKHFAVADYLHRHGPGTGLLSTAAGMALLLDVSIWRLLAGAIRDSYRRRRTHTLVGHQLTLVGPAVSDNPVHDDRFDHPWFRAQTVGTRSALVACGAITWPHAFYHPLGHADDRHPQRLSPLLSQPLVELCLRIPSYVHAAGYRDRGLARQAFAADVPAEILRRQWKDRAAGATESAMAYNLPFIRDLLLDGTLVQRQLVDRSKLEAALSDRAGQMSATAPFEILDHVITESWLQHAGSYPSHARRADYASAGTAPASQALDPPAR